MARHLDYERVPEYLVVGRSGNYGRTTTRPNGETLVDLDGQRFDGFDSPEEAEDFIERYENGELPW